MPEKPDTNTAGAPRPVPQDVEEKQDPEYSPEDFDRDLETATKRLDDPSEPAPGSYRR